VFIPDEIVKILRKVRGKEVADKYYRRILKGLREPQLNLVCRKHNIDWRLPYDEKVKAIIKEGISIINILTNDVHKEILNLTDKKKWLTEFCENQLRLTSVLKGSTLE